MAMQHADKEEIESEPLHEVDVDTIKKDLDLSGEISVDEQTVDHAILERADSVTEQLFALNADDLDKSATSKSAIEHLGLKVQVESAKLNTMLNAPIGKLAKRSEDGGSVANALVDLKIQVEETDPSNFDFEPGWFSRLLGHLPFVGTPIKRYFSQFEKTSTIIEAISNSLKQGKGQLERDNTTLTDDQKRMRELTHKLEQTIQLAQLIDQKLTTRMERELSDGAKLKFLQEEILFPLRQRIMDLQQQLVVNQQGIIAIELIIRNNKELIRGVNRTLNVTMSALKVGATLAIALADQKIVLDKINSVNEATNKLIAGTAERLKTQGAEIHKQASSTQLDMAVLHQAFVDIRSALDDIASFRQQALPKMAETIIELNDISKVQEDVVQDLEKGNEMSSPFDFSDEQS
jgi:uncharacterized protein YaaN involved in tellurite resistance